MRPRELLRGVYWPSAFGAGVVSGSVFLSMQMGLGRLIYEKSPWISARKIAAIALGPEVLSPPATFEVSIFLVAMAVHFTLSITYSTIGTIFLHRLTLLRAAVYGGLYGLPIYLVNFYGFTLFFPWFEETRSWLRGTASHSAPRPNANKCVQRDPIPHFCSTQPELPRKARPVW